MKTTPLLLLAVFSFQFSVCAQDAAPPDVVAQFISGQAANHPWMTALATVVGFLRLVFKPLVSAAHNFVENTADPDDDEALKRVERSLAFRVFAFLLDWTTSVKLERPVGLGTTKLLSLLFAFLLLPLAFSVSGCATLEDKWESLSPAQQAALRAVAKTAISIGLGELGDNVKELRPYTERLTPLIETTFASATGTPASLASEVRASVAATVPEAHRPAVINAVRIALLGSSTAAAATVPGRRPTQQTRFNRALAAKL